jgi:hypothetical protein
MLLYHLLVAENFAANAEVGQKEDHLENPRSATKKKRISRHGSISRDVAVSQNT